jgi:CheY-like chemotaxis protein
MNHTVLYIEDNQDNVHLIERLLARRPHIQLLTASTARDGVGTATTRRPALILLDNHLPDATGSTVLMQLSGSEATAGIPVVIVSGDSGRQAAAKLLASGAAEFLTKPFDIHQFLATIDRYVPGGTAGPGAG